MLPRLEQLGADEAMLRPVREYHELEAEQEGQALGDSLPIGLRLRQEAAGPSAAALISGGLMRHRPVFVGLQPTDRKASSRHSVGRFASRPTGRRQTCSAHRGRGDAAMAGRVEQLEERTRSRQPAGQLAMISATALSPSLVTASYAVTGAPLAVPMTLAIYRSPTSTFGSSSVLVGQTTLQDAGARPGFAPGEREPDSTA